jgi:RNA methyltransferase, TrmH family
MIQISSSSNEKFRTWESLLSSKGIKEHGLFLLSGEKLVREFLKKPSSQVVAEIIPKSGKALFELSENFELSMELFNELDELGTHFNLLVLKTPEILNYDIKSEPKGLEVLCPLGDPANVGALIRSAEGFGASKVILTQESANPFLPKSVKASSGSILRMALVKAPALANLQSSHNVVVLDAGGDSLANFQWPENIRLLVGEEGQGMKNLSANLKTKVLSIDTVGVESLNAVVAASVAMFDYRSKTGN